MNRASFEPDFELLVRSEGPDAPVIEVNGELDSGACQELETAFQEALAARGEGAITLDLSGLRFIDSAGTRSVIMIERAARDQGVSLVVIPPPDEVTELLRTAGVIERVQLSPAAPGGVIDSSTPLERVELELPRDPQSPARARAEVRELLAGREPTEVGDVVLLTSELVTNAVVHPKTPRAPIGLRMFTYADGIRVEVDDNGEGFEPIVLRRPEGEGEGGRGLFLVDGFASRWGTERLQDARGPRFMVWFELDWGQQGAAETAAM